MQLSDNVSLILQHSHPLTIFTLPEPQDPTYLFDLKTHLNDNPEYRKARIEWKKTKPIHWDLWRVKEEFFQYYCENDLPTFHQDIFYFVRAHPGLSPEEGAKAFCGKWKGYEKTYGEEFVRRAMLRCELPHAKAVRLPVSLP